MRENFYSGMYSNDALINTSFSFFPLRVLNTKYCSWGDKQEILKSFPPTLSRTIKKQNCLDTNISEIGWFIPRQLWQSSWTSILSFMMMDHIRVCSFPSCNKLSSIIMRIATTANFKLYYLKDIPDFLGFMCHLHNINVDLPPLPRLTFHFISPFLHIFQSTHKKKKGTGAVKHDISGAVLK